VTDLLAGQVQVLFDVTPTAIPQIKAGKLRALAVTTAKRIELLPDVPTVGDFLPGYEATAWIGIGVPKDTPPAVIEMLNAAINAAIVDATIKARLTDLGAIMLPPASPADFGKFIAEETEKWGKVVKFSGAKAD
jgi:tripartite-type tricarboxylate transporter receptor subunit TctC